MKSTALKSVFYTLLCSVLTLAAVADNETESGPSPGAIWVMDVDGAIGPATSDYLVRSFEKAATASASLNVIRMNTPGGLDSSMRDIIQAILSSPVPVATYVSPQGSRAASAGTYILYASHISAMAPATNLGAATPVQIGAPSAPSSPETGEEKESAPDGKTAMEKKMVNDASAYIRGLADLYGRNADWAEKAVREAASLSAKEALEENVIDYVAVDLEDLIKQVDGKIIKLNNEPHSLALAGKPVHHQSPDWRTEILAVITDPNLVLILGMIGIYGIILEFYNPGSAVPGIVGIICLLLAGYSLQLLPVNYAGLALLVFGIGLMVAEAMAPSFGIMGIGGIISFAIGGLFLFDTEMEAFQVGYPVLAAVTLITAAFLIITIHIAMKMRKQKAVSGVETIIGQMGEALADFETEGMIKVAGEIWHATVDEPVNKGDKVNVIAVNSLTLKVGKIQTKKVEKDEIDEIDEIDEREENS